MQIRPEVVRFIQKQVNDTTLSFNLFADFNSSAPDYRKLIRDHLFAEHSAHFSREQLAQLSDLQVVPKASQGHFSISHNQKIGGFSYSELHHGFDAEVTKRISSAIIERTSTVQEIKDVPDLSFLWVAKEAAFKALDSLTLDRPHQLIMTDLICTEWQSHPDTRIASFRIASEKTLAQLYDPDKMPQGLREAHYQLDLAVERCYRNKPFASDEERLEYLFKLYEQMINEEKDRSGELNFEPVKINTKKRKYA